MVAGRAVTLDTILFAEGRIEATLTLRARSSPAPAQLEQLTAGLIATRFD